MYGKNFDFKTDKGSSKKNPYDRRAYESVDDRSHSLVISQKINGKQNSGTNAWVNERYHDKAMILTSVQDNYNSIYQLRTS